MSGMQYSNRMGRLTGKEESFPVYEEDEVPGDNVELF